MKVVIVGGVAGGASAAARIRRLDEHAQIIMIERSGYVSYANCGLPYYVGGVIKEQEELTLQTPESFWDRFRIDVRVRQEVTAINPTEKTAVSYTHLLRLSASIYMRAEIAAAFEKNIAFSFPKCYNRYIPKTKGGASMPRPPRCRRICGAPQVDTFCPNGCEDAEPILLTLDEYEAIRLVDLEQKTHEQCAAQMDISRSTVQEIYESARRKIAAYLVHGKPLHITGGNYRICGGQEAAHCGRCCRMQRANLSLIHIFYNHIFGTNLEYFSMMNTQGAVVLGMVYNLSLIHI